jgi:hypothetical protein
VTYHAESCGWWTNGACDCPEGVNDRIKKLEERVKALEYAQETACENTPTKGCECPGCETARERAKRGEA